MHEELRHRPAVFEPLRDRRGSRRTEQVIPELELNHRRVVLRKTQEHASRSQSGGHERRVRSTTR